jgi:hypothetical protein
LNPPNPPPRYASDRKNYKSTQEKRSTLYHTSRMIIGIKYRP